jgi:hypothetical protein
MNSLLRSTAVFCAAALLALPASAQVRVKLEPVADGLVHPLVMAWPDDGSKRRFGPGDCFMADDLTGQGHLTRDVQGPMRSLYVHLPDDLDVAVWRS